MARPRTQGVGMVVGEGQMLAQSHPATTQLQQHLQQQQHVVGLDVHDVIQQHVPTQGFATVSVPETSSAANALIGAAQSAGKIGPGKRVKKQRVNKTGQKRTQLTKSQHREILYLCQQPGTRKKDIAQQFNVVKSTISGICKHYKQNGGFIDGSENSIKSRSATGADVLDEPLMAWVRSRRRAWKKSPGDQVMVTESMICDEAKRLARLPENAVELKEGWLPNRTWVKRFNIRHNIFLIPKDPVKDNRIQGPAGLHTASL